MFAPIKNFNSKQMKMQKTWLVMVGLFLMLCATSCKRADKPFTFSYSMESVNNFKVMLSFDSDKKYRVERYNYFMDNFAHKRDPKIVEGVLTDKEYDRLATLVNEADLLSMEDSYGFDKAPTGGLSDIVYQLSYTSGGEEKYISIRSTEGQRYSDAFVELVREITRFNDEKLK